MPVLTTINQAAQRAAFMLLLRRASLALEGLAARLRVALLGRLGRLGRAGRDMEESRTVESEEEESEEADSEEVDSEEVASEDEASAEEVESE
jgi:hypothetical protein